MIQDGWVRQAELLRVIDGDTQWFRLDLGYRISADFSVRTLGVNAPALSTDAGKVAGSWAGAWFAEHWHDPEEAWPYWVRTEKDRMSFNRYLGQVQCKQGHDFGADLLASGNAVAWP